MPPVVAGYHEILAHEPPASLEVVPAVGFGKPQELFAGIDAVAFLVTIFVVHHIQHVVERPPVTFDHPSEPILYGHVHDVAHTVLLDVPIAYDELAVGCLPAETPAVHLIPPCRFCCKDVVAVCYGTDTPMASNSHTL
ncbi:MAG: hypothetical protein IJ856_01615 [Candidatus Methanomethylophilaceae archaeon]|nr:hypothetical protein [Candidatus Methanomethylophilaceae archaeon]